MGGWPMHRRRLLRPQGPLFRLGQAQGHLLVCIRHREGHLLRLSHPQGHLLRLCHESPATPLFF
jgi:hypothetical protein